MIAATIMQAPEHVHWRRFDAEIVVVDLRGGEYFGLSDVAADAFERLAAGQPVGDVVGALLAIYDVERRRLEGDVGDLVKRLMDRGLLVRGALP
ncbi:MAG: PqqD family protein [Polyangiaceae bacterium]